METQKGENHFDDVGRRMILKWVLKNRMRVCGFGLI
jgi:hypothetical protein